MKEMVDELAWVLAQTVRDLGLSREQALRLINNKAEMAAAVREVIMELADSDHTKAASAEDVCQSELADLLTLGERAYEIFSLLKDGEGSIKGEAMVERAKKLGANLGEDDGRYILEHQSEIPAHFRDKVIFVFTDWWAPDGARCVHCVYWNGSWWRKDSVSLAGFDCYIGDRVVRRVKTRS